MSKHKKCKHCKEEMNPIYNSLQKYCVNKSECVAVWIELEKEKQWKKKKSKIRQDLMTLQDYLKICQTLFNKYIRQRDDGKMCISCGNMTAKRDAGHFYSVGNYPSVRFHEDNCHSQCVHCNQYRGGNIHDYKRNLVLRIGEDRLNELDELAHKTRKYTVDEVKDLIKKYKELTK
jgi:hypothetical protein